VVRTTDAKAETPWLDRMHLEMELLWRQPQ
jgi:hypothetical protein